MSSPVDSSPAGFTKGGTAGLALTVVFGLGLIVSLAGVVVRREGNLAWDDADYLRRGLHVARLAGAGGGAGLSLPVAVRQTLKERPKPPLLVVWVAGMSLLTGRQTVLPLIVASSVVPFALLVAGVAVIAGRLAGRHAVLAAVLALAASPLALSYGAKVMVETFLSLWVLATFAAAASLLARPSARAALALGTALGLAMLTKLTVALLLPVPALLFLVRYARRYPLDRSSARLAGCVLLPVALVAGPWYLKNAGEAVRFAVFSSRYNVAAEARDDSTPALDRVHAYLDGLVGWPLVAVAVAAGLTQLRRGGGAEWGGGPALSAFVELSAAGALSGALILLIPSYFDPRFLLPAWPSLAVGLGGLFARAGGRSPGKVVIVHAALVACVVPAACRLAGEGRTATSWAASRLVDDLVARYGVATIANAGNSPDWNVCKTGLINELRATPGDCFVIHDFSGIDPAEVRRRLPRVGAVVVLDRDSLPPAFLEAAPGLNRSVQTVVEALNADPHFHRVGVDRAGLPPLAVYVRDTASPRAALALGRGGEDVRR
jgi:hypothetical protein